MDEQRRLENLNALRALGRPVHVGRLSVGRPVKLLEGSNTVTGAVLHKSANLVTLATDDGKRVLLPDVLVALG
tara:strand:+ start:358 stop:576 length:219 start_codon:yes stop_codon:yes gene_type:complete